MYNQYAEKKEKCNHIKCLIKTKKGRKRAKHKKIGIRIRATQRKQ